MKKFSKISTLLLFVFIAIATSSMSKAAAPHIGEAHAIYMRFLSGDHVTAGSAITAALNSNFDTQAELTVENLAGKRFVETQIALEEGFNMIKFNVAEIPSGVYFIKVKSSAKTQTLTFVVK